MITINFAIQQDKNQGSSVLSQTFWSIVYYLLWTAVAIGLLWYIKIILNF